MNVKELKVILENLPDDLLVVCAKDGEGNGFNELYSVDTNMVCSGEYELEVHCAELTPELEEDGYTEEDIKKGNPCIVLWP